MKRGVADSFSLNKLVSKGLNTLSPIAFDSPKLDGHVKAMAAVLFERHLNMFKNVDPEELKGNKFVKKPSEAPNANAFMDEPMKLSKMVVDHILKASPAKLQQNIYNFYVRLIQECIENNNFLAAKAIYTGLNAGPIDRLSYLDGPAREFIQGLQNQGNIFDSRYGNAKLKEIQNSAQGIVIPSSELIKTELVQTYERVEKQSAREEGEAKSIAPFTQLQQRISNEPRSVLPSSDVSEEIEGLRLNDETAYQISTEIFPPNSVAPKYNKNHKENAEQKNIEFYMEAFSLLPGSVKRTLKEGEVAIRKHQENGGDFPGEQLVGGIDPKIVEAKQALVAAKILAAYTGNDSVRQAAQEAIPKLEQALVDLNAQKAQIKTILGDIRKDREQILAPEGNRMEAVEQVPIMGMVEVPLTSSPESSPQASPRKNSSDNIVQKKAAKILGVEGINDKAAKQLGLDLNALGGAAEVVKTSPRSPRSPREVLGNLWTNVKAVFSPRVDPNTSPVRRVSLAEVDFPPEESLPQGVQVKGDRIIKENKTERPNAGMEGLRAEAKAQEKAIDELKEAEIKRENKFVIGALERAYNPDERPNVRIRDNSVTILIKNEQDKTQLKEALQKAGVTAEVTNFGVSISREQVKALMKKPEGEKSLVSELKRFKEEKKAIEELKAVKANPLALLNSRLQEAADQFNARQPTPTIAVQDVGGDARQRNKEKQEGSPLLLSVEGQRATSTPAQPGEGASIKDRQSYFEEFSRPKDDGATSQDNSKKYK